MNMTRAELQEAAQQAFGGTLAPDAQHGWNLIADMGWLMMAVPQTLGGLGLRREATGIVHRSLGQALMPGPAIAQMMVIEALAAAPPSPERDERIASAMAGQVMTTSIGPPDMPLSCVPDADRATHILVVTPHHVRLHPMIAGRAKHRATWDQSRRLFDIAPFDEDTGLLLATGNDAALLAHRLQASLLFHLAADSIGGADAILSLTIDYLGTRRQFDRPLAMFQALKHRIADLKTGLDAAEALLWSRAVDPAATLTDFGALKAVAAAAYRAVAEEAIQLHGGIGLTMEHPCHLFLKRAMLNSVLGGGGDYWDEAAGRAAMALASA